MFLQFCITILIYNFTVYINQDTSTKSRERQWANRLAISTAWSDNEESEEETEITDQEYKVCRMDL